MQLIRPLERPLGAWSAFSIVHLLLVASSVAAVHLIGFADVPDVYAPWAAQWRAGGPPVGVDLPWVYPIGALAVVLPPALLGTGTGYVLGWLVLAVATDAAAFVVVRRAGAPAIAAWLACLLALGPVAIGRIDVVASACCVAALLGLARRPATAGALLAAGAAVKIWPAAVLLAVLVVVRGGRRRVAAGAVAAAGAILLAGLAVGAGPQLLSFVAAQGGRGVQVEAIPATPVLWWGALHGGVRVAFDEQLLTYQVHALGLEVVAAASAPTQLVLAVAVLLIGGLAVRRGPAARLVLPQVVLGMVLVLVVANKVGSPQYLAWLAPPVVVGMATDVRRFRVPAVVVVGASALTQVLYGAFRSGVYAAMLDLQPVGLVVLAARNLLLVVLLGWSIVGLVRSAIGARDRGRLVTA